MILIADAAWDAIAGAALIAASIASVTRPLGTGPLRPGLVPIALGAVCLAVAALMIHASTGTQAAAFCRLIAPGNVAGAIAALALLIAFPDAAHPYVVALAVGGAGCAVFATLEYQAQRPEAHRARVRQRGLKRQNMHHDIEPDTAQPRRGCAHFGPPR